MRWLPWGLVAVLAVVLGVILSRPAPEPDTSLRDAYAQTVAAKAVAARDSVWADSLVAVVDSVKAEQETATDTFTAYRDRWRDRPADMTDSAQLALADSTVAACTWALSACERTVTAMTEAMDAQKQENASLRFEVGSLELYTRELEARLNEGGDPFWPTPVLIGGGALIGYSAGGFHGALKGAAVGLTADVAWRYLDSVSEWIR